MRRLRAALTADRVRTALLVVCVLHAVTPLLLRGLHPGYGWDETVYIRQIDPHSPTGVFTAPRARGLTLLTAPASLMSASETVMRLWLALLSGIGLYLAFLPWLRLRRSYVVPAAAALWSGLWVGIYYSYEAMPNQYVAYGALAACGWLLLAMREPARRRNLWYAGLALALTALIRPSDSLFLAVPLVIATLVIRGQTRRQRGLTIAVLVVGLAAGFAEWIVEAYVSYGGPIARFHAASAENAGGLHWALGAQFRTLAGPVLCRGSCHPHPSVATQLWWFALIPLVATGIWAARRRNNLASTVLPTAAALAIGAEYIVAVNYSAPRFMEPTYALLSLPVAEALLWLAGRAIARSRPAVASGRPRPAMQLAALAAGLVLLGGHEAVQADIVHKLNVAQEHKTAEEAAVADFVNDVGVRGKCLVRGAEAGPISFLAHCPDTPSGFTSVRQLAHIGTGIAVVAHGIKPPVVSADTGLHWQEHSLRPPYSSEEWHAWIHLPAHRTGRSVLHDKV